MRRYNYIFDGTLKAGHDFTYKYDPKDPFRLLSVDAKEYRSSTEEVDTIRCEHSYAFDGNGNLVLQLSDLAERIDSASFADTAAMQVRQYLWDEDNRMLAANVNGFVSNYFYDAAGERTVKISAPDLAVFVNGAEALKNDSALVKFVGYVSPYLVVSNGGRYTKHIYAGTQRIASKVGDIEAFGADPRRVEYAGANLKEVDFGSKYEQQTKALLARYDSLGVEHRPNTLNDYVGGQSFCCGEKELVSNNQTGDNTFETPDYEQLIFFYHPDHLGSTSLVTDNSGNVVQSVAYIPYGEVFIEERNGTWNTPYLFNGKELDEETGLYYYGARYLNPTNGMWLSVDPLFEKYAGMSPYNYCAGNPVKLVDPDGRSLAVLQAPKGAGGAGHLAILIQNEDRKWALYSKNGTNENWGISGENVTEDNYKKDGKRIIDKGQHTFDTVEEFLNSTENPIDEDGERQYTEAFLIECGPEIDREAEKGAMSVLNEDYDVLDSNCAQVVQAALKRADFNDGSDKKEHSIDFEWGPIKIHEKYTEQNMRPNKIYESIKANNNGTAINVDD